MHTSAVLQAVSTRARKSQRTLKANVQRREELQRQAQQNRPHVVLGHKASDAAKWQDCDLAQVLIARGDLIALDAEIFCELIRREPQHGPACTEPAKCADLIKTIASDAPLEFTAGGKVDMAWSRFFANQVFHAHEPPCDSCVGEIRKEEEARRERERRRSRVGG